jgi:hypothetical protein
LPPLCWRDCSLERSQNNREKEKIKKMVVKVFFSIEWNPDVRLIRFDR